MKIRSEKGIALPLVMLVIMVGALVIPAFLGRVSTGLMGSRDYRNVMDAQYACDAGVEHAIWNLVEGGLDASIPDVGDSTVYTLDESINGMASNVKVSNTCEVIAWDDFESGLWTGGEGWLGNWAYAGDALVTTIGTPYEGSYHLRLRSYTGTVSRAVDLSQQVNAHLAFQAKVNSAEPGDSVIFRISHDGSDWTTVYTWDSTASDNAYHYYDIDLSPYGLNDTFYISFASNMNSAFDYFYVDNLEVIWPAVEFGLIAWDDFESGLWTGGEGWLGNWAYAGDALVTTIGTPYEGSYHLRLRSYTGTVSRAVDLSQQVNAHLAFQAKVNSAEPGDSVIFRISHDGSDWTTVYTWDSTASDNAYHYYDIDLSPYGLNDTFYISFASNMNSAFDYFYVDDISIDASRAYCITVTSGDRILKAAVDFINGEATVLCWWFVV